MASVDIKRSIRGIAPASQNTELMCDLDRTRRAVPTRPRLIDEPGVCVRNRLDRACALLTAELTSGRVVPRAGTSVASCLGAVPDGRT